MYMFLELHALTHTPFSEYAGHTLTQLSPNLYGLLSSEQLMDTIHLLLSPTRCDGH